MLLQGPVNHVDPVIFEGITPELIQNLTIKTQGAAGPSLQNAEDWRRIIGSKLFGNEGGDLCKVISVMARQLSTEKLNDP